MIQTIITIVGFLNNVHIIITTFTLFHEHAVYTSFLLSSLYMHTATRRVNLLINRTNNVPRDTWWCWLSLGLLIARKIQLSCFLFNFCPTTTSAPPSSRVQLVSFENTLTPSHPSPMEFSLICWCLNEIHQKPNRFVGNCFLFFASSSLNIQLLALVWLKTETENIWIVRRRESWREHSSSYSTCTFCVYVYEEALFPVNYGLGKFPFHQKPCHKHPCNVAGSSRVVHPWYVSLWLIICQFQCIKIWRIWWF